MLTWEYEDDDYHYTNYWTGRRGQILVGRVTHSYNHPNEPYQCIMWIGNKTINVNSFDEGKKWIEDKFEEVCRDADLVPSENLPEIY